MSYFLAVVKKVLKFTGARQMRNRGQKRRIENDESYWDARLQIGIFIGRAFPSDAHLMAR